MPELVVCPQAPELTPQVSALVARYAPHDCPVVITGPIGVGKTHLARVIHERSGRAGSFVPVPLTSLQPGFENVTLAGHDKGAYTGAHQGRGGLLAEAHRGTLFFDEIGDASLESQRILLELLPERGLRRLGEARRVAFDLRFILATHIDLDRATAEGRFREDLLSRLGHCWIHLPPLRERPEEIPGLVGYYLDRLTAGGRGERPRLSPALWSTLGAAPWIYNVRSLVNECQALVTATPSTSELGLDHLSDRFWHEVSVHLRERQDDPSRAEYALALVDGERRHAARLLDVSESTLHRRLATDRPKRAPGRPRTGGGQKELSILSGRGGLTIFES